MAKNPNTWLAGVLAGSVILLTALWLGCAKPQENTQAQPDKACRAAR